MPDYYPLIARAVSRLPSNKAAARQTLLHSRVLPLLCVMLLFSSCPGSALDEANRFIEIPSDIEITAFDLSTVQVIQPGRFAVINTSIARPDIMKFKLKVLDTMRDYCARADGKYAANGIRSKYLFDCKRGLTGLFIHEDDDPAKVITFFVSQHTDLYTFYLAVCSRVMHEVPYLPE
jgi:hypothetical protein